MVRKPDSGTVSLGEVWDWVESRDALFTGARLCLLSFVRIVLINSCNQNTEAKQ